MNTNRFKAIEAQQTAIAQRVLAVVPLLEWWKPIFIAREYVRINHLAVPIRTIEGCLRALKEAGLIKERAFTFQRVLVHQELEKVVPQQVGQHAPPVVEMSAFKQLEEIAKRMRVMADDIDRVALKHADEIEAATKDNAQLKQLKALLKELS